MIRSLLIFAITFTGFKTLAQTCTIVSSDIVCWEELISFDVTSSSGIGSVLWEMGDATTSTQQSFSHKYSTKGVKNVKVTVNLTGGGTCVATKQITVYELPSFKISMKPDNNYCLWQNNVCLIDSSTGGDSGITTKKRIIIWDDGNQDVTTNPPMGDEICHHYKNPGTFKVTIELTNDKDCKMEKIIEITILKDVVPDISVFSIENEVLRFCDSARTEFYDVTKVDTSTILNKIYDWGDGSPLITTRSSHVSHFYKNSGFYGVSLSYVQKNGCVTKKDTVIEVIVFRVAFNLTKNAYKQCLGSVFRFTHNDLYSGAYYKWFLNDTLLNIYPEDQLDAKFFDMSARTGISHVFVTITNHGCTKTSPVDSFITIGMIPDVMVLNDNQCTNKDTVYFIPKIRQYGIDKLSFIWNFGDDSASQCTTNTALGLDLNSNCNYSADSLVKHFYLNGVCRQWSLLIIDTFSGCGSQMLGGWINVVKDTSAKFEYYADRLCIGNKNDYYVGFKHNLCGAKKIQVNLDSACDRDKWSVKFISQIPYTKTCNKDGWVTVGFALSYGNHIVYTGYNDTVDYYIDSSRVCNDTIWMHNWFKLGNDPVATFTPNVECINYTSTVTVKDSIQKDIAFSIWNWGDKSKLDTFLMAKGDSIVTAPNHIFKRAGTFYISHYIENEGRCYSWAKQKVNEGFNMNFTNDSLNCPGSPVQFTDVMNYTDSTPGQPVTNSINYWHIAERRKLDKELLRWDFDDGRGFATDTPLPVFKFPKSGSYRVRLAARDSIGCWDTFTRIIKVGAAYAGIKHISKRIICDGIVQLYDSSYSDFASDSIVKYYWEFGDGGNPSFVRNPFHYYSTFGEYTIFQKVESFLGCIDTAYIKIIIEGPVAHFDIVSDSVGCAPFTAEFKNNSILTKDFIWYFGDSLITKLSTNRDTNVKFTYKKPGIYYIHLFGSDSVINPNAGNTIYYCKTFFPDTTVANPIVRKIIVLPAPEADFNVNFIQCKGQPIIVTAKSDSLYISHRWTIKNIDSLVSSDTFGTLYSSDTGTFMVKYAPWYPPQMPYNISCFDTVTKPVKLTGVKAEFDLLEDTSSCPVYTFTNQTKDFKTITWDLGDPGAGQEKNIRHESQFSYKYVSRKGEFVPCLFAENNDGCRDTLCTTVNVDFVVKLKIPNVFTPGNNDNLNDAFDIETEGMEEYHLLIYNRWGQKLFETNNDGIGDDGNNWRGRPNVLSDLYPDGTYFYILNYKIKCEDKAKETHGTITLIGSKD